MRRTLITLALGLVLAGCGSSQSTTTSRSMTKMKMGSSAGPAVEHATVKIQNFMFSPMHINVKVGGTVTFHNYDGTAHTATALNGGFDTGTVKPGESVTIKLTKAGTFPYHCLFHEFMKATIKVS